MNYENRGFIGDDPPPIPSNSNDNTSQSMNSSSILSEQKNYGKKQNLEMSSRNENKRSSETSSSSVVDNNNSTDNNNTSSKTLVSSSTTTTTTTTDKRGNWGNDIEFLMSCIAMSVGLGNVWRFPFTALENGGGAFLIPYLIVLLLVGRPIYYLEMIIGQFSSRGSVKVYDLCPAMKGAGYGQVYAVSLLSTYYASLMALIVSYLIDSFKTPLPWTECRNNWPNCISSNGESDNFSNITNTENSNLTSSSEYYFVKEVLQEVDSIADGIGIPNWKLTLFLACSWLTVLMILINGVRSSGKASYFLALFPYVVMGILLIRAVTLPGAVNGILYFVTPQWDKIMDPDVWYAAVTQCFFSLSVCFGNIIMYSSYNKFSHNIYRDATVVTVLDTFTSMMAGCTIFGILGNLAHEVGTTNVASVVQSGTGLAFVSYPEAISKFDIFPQGFSVLFFFMLFVLGVGSNVAMASCVMTVIRDQFPRVKLWQAAIIVTTVGFVIGLSYVTPGGQFILTLVDFFGTSFIAFVLAIAELVAIGWIYGVDRICRDTEFMIGRNPGIYWRICWGLITPLLMFVILIYTFATYKPLTYKDISYPDTAIAAGWTIAAFGIMQLPIWAIVSIIQQKNCSTLLEKIKSAFRPKADWGPREPVNYDRYQKHLSNTENNNLIYKNNKIFYRFKKNIFG